MACCWRRKGTKGRAYDVEALDDKDREVHDGLSLGPRVDLRLGMEHASGRVGVVGRAREEVDLSVLGDLEVLGGEAVLVENNKVADESSL